MKGKRGQNFQVVGIILAVVIGIILLFASDNIISAFSSRTAVEQCRASLTPKVLGVKDSKVELNCPTQYVTIQKKGYVLNSQYDERLPYDTTDLDVEIKRVIADQMYDCAYKFGHYDINIFSSNTWTGSNHCIICGQISFDDEVEEEVGEKVTGFSEFLYETPLPFGKPGRNDEDGNYILTYQDYLLKTQTKTERKFFFIYEPDQTHTTLDAVNEFELGESYFILFTEYAPSSQAKGFPINVLGFETTLRDVVTKPTDWIGLGGSIDHKVDYKQTVVLVKSSNFVGEKCDQIG